MFEIFKFALMSEAMSNGLKKFWVPALVLFIIAILFGIVIVVLSKVFAVPVDENVEKVRDNLAGANCGACGYAGCDDFAKALCAGKTELSGCSVTDKAHKKIIASLLGQTSEEEDFKVVVKCRGGERCKNKFTYEGYEDCKIEHALNGGHKACGTGCCGFKTCEKVCPADAIHVQEEKYAFVDQDKCIKCGLCVTNCPKSVIVKVPSHASILVACQNHGKGKEVKSICSVGCIACGICSKVCPNGAITMVDNLPVIDYAKCKGADCGLCVKKCPCGTIVRI